MSPRKTIVLIPARYGSTRFPGKPLALLGGRAVIEHVAEAALKTHAARPVFVATDDERIAETVRAAFSPDDVAIVMTGDCRTGTDRLAQAVRALFGDDIENLIVVNVQGDEPFINPQHVNALIAAMHEDLPMATLATPLPENLTHDPNVVKVVCAQNGDALYFSRLPIPFERDGGQSTVDSGLSTSRLRHLGVYAYRAAWLLQMAELPSTPLEESEKLEQLRALENGVKIRVVKVENVIDIAIDTPEDLEQAEQFIHRRDAKAQSE
jgi:3-deoxy-manno-octulosonate cytidylyltransferase (CMP-KDO synthetase)